jgi:plasmid maintenance system antidote protein VapI
MGRSVGSAYLPVNANVGDNRPQALPTFSAVNTIGDRIRQRREALGKTQQQVADHLHIDRVNVTQWETGVTKPSRDRIPQLADILQVDVDWILRDGNNITIIEAKMPQRGSLSAVGRRLETIRKACGDDLPERLGLTPQQWQELIRQNAPLTSELALKIHEQTGLPPGYVAFGDTIGMSSDVLSRLLHAALSD